MPGDSTSIHINSKGMDMVDAQVYIINAKQIVENEPHEDE